MEIKSPTMLQLIVLWRVYAVNKLFSLFSSIFDKYFMTTGYQGGCYCGVKTQHPLNLWHLRRCVSAEKEGLLTLFLNSFMCTWLIWDNITPFKSLFYPEEKLDKCVYCNVIWVKPKKAVHSSFFFFLLLKCSEHFFKANLNLFYMVNISPLPPFFGYGRGEGVSYIILLTYKAKGCMSYVL